MKLTKIIAIAIIILAIIALIFLLKPSSTDSNNSGDTAVTTDEQTALDSSADSLDTTSLPDSSIDDLAI